MAGELAGLSVLVTRPADRAGSLVEAIAAAGGAAVSLPLLRIEPLSEPRDAAVCRRTRSRILELDRYRRLIFISVNAVRYGMEWIHQYWPQFPVGVDVYAIGRATAEALAAERLPATSPGAGMDSESLLALPDFARPAGERILIFRGVGGREHLARQLRERGAAVDYAECYRRLPPAVNEAQLKKTLVGGSVDCIVVNSGETLQHLAKLLAGEQGVSARRRPLVVPSERVAAAARQAGFDRVVVAANAGVEATMAALRSVAQIRSTSG